MSSRFLTAIAVNHGITKNEHFLKEAGLYLRHGVDIFDLKQTAKMLDLFKFLEGFSNSDTKRQLEKRLTLLRLESKTQDEDRSEDEI